MEPNCQLEEFFVTKLHLDCRGAGDSVVEATQIETALDYTIGVHNKHPYRYRLTLRVMAQDLSANGVSAGTRVEAEVVGYLSVKPEVTGQEREWLARVNGVSILYGLLRGIVATATGAFPKGKILLPAVMPQDVVKHVESSKPKKPKAGAAKSAPKPKGKDAAAK